MIGITTKINVIPGAPMKDTENKSSWVYFYYYYYYSLFVRLKSYSLVKLRHGLFRDIVYS